MERPRFSYHLGCGHSSSSEPAFLMHRFFPPPLGPLNSTTTPRYQQGVRTNPTSYADREPLVHPTNRRTPRRGLDALPEPGCWIQHILRCGLSSPNSFTRGAGSTAADCSLTTPQHQSHPLQPPCHFSGQTRKGLPPAPTFSLEAFICRFVKTKRSAKDQ